jgi:hypothetical protein
LVTLAQHVSPVEHAFVGQPASTLLPPLELPLLLPPLELPLLLPPLELPLLLPPEPPPLPLPLELPEEPPLELPPPPSWLTTGLGVELLHATQTNALATTAVALKKVTVARDAIGIPPGGGGNLARARLRTRRTRRLAVFTRP